jgi:hypothetical protein
VVERSAQTSDIRALARPIPERREAILDGKVFVISKFRNRPGSQTEGAAQIRFAGTAVDEGDLGA